MTFPEYACPYARDLAEKSPQFARQIRYSALEEEPDGFAADPFGELGESSVCFGVKRRFPDRVLVMASGRCFANCRHCTRRGLLGGAEIVDTPERLAAARRYVAADPDIHDVLISGGDPLTLDDGRVMEFVNAFASLDQIESVRLCTRALCTNPDRVSGNLAEALAASGKVWVNTQFNHASEMTAQAAAACARLVERGIPVSCQSVMLAGVNDSAEAMLDLFRALRRARVRPYYVFMCDPVAGISHFRVPLEKARAIELECAGKIGGLALPRFVADVPGAARKIPIAELARA